MSKLFYIAYEEIGVHLKEWTFYLTAIGMPLVFAAIGLLPQLRAVAQKSPLSSVETVFTEAETVTTPTGYIDHAGVIVVLPDDLAENLRAFANEKTANAALEAGTIERYYVIEADYRTSSNVIEYSATPQLMPSSDGAIRKLLRENALHALNVSNPSNPPNLADRVENPIHFEREGRPEPPVFSFIPANLARNTLMSAGLVVGLFAYIINVGGYLIVRALKRETRARVLEVIITSTTPGQFIGGKLLGLATLSLGQAALTLLAGTIVYGQAPHETGPAALPPAMLALSLPYLLCGYLSYCGGIMGVAAIWPALPESATLLAAARLLALSPIVGVVFILPNPDSLTSVALTTIPFSAPLLMPFRLLVTTVPLWQWAAGLVGLILWTTFTIWLSTRLFRLNTLLTGRSSSPRALWQAIQG